MKAQQRSKTLWLLLSSSALSLVILFLSQGKVFTHPLSFPLRVGIACSMVTGSLVAWALSGRRIFPWGAGLSGLIFISILTVNLAPPTLPARAAPAALRISGIQANASSVGLYEKFELTFSVEGSVATNPYFPYDPSPPNGVPARVGITVEGLFTPDNWQTVLIQPGFLYQAYERRCIFDGRPVDPCPPNGEEWLYPQGNPVWKVRFAPQQLGTWRYRLRVTDASGTVESQEGTFDVRPSTLPHNHGFIRISQRDPGYFEYSDGAPFIGVGHGEGFSGWRFTYDADDTLRRLERGRVNLIRMWMSGSNIYMAPWSPWHSHHLPGEGGYFNAVSLTYAEYYGNNRFSLRLWDYNDPQIENRRNPCMFQGFTNNVAVKPNTTYQLSVRLKAVNVSGPRIAGHDYGFIVRKAGWLGDTCWNPVENSKSPGRRLLNTYVKSTNGWTTVTSTFTTGANEYFLDNLYLILENTTGGDVYVDEVSIRELVNGSPSGAEVLRKNRFAYHLYFDQQPSWQWDYLFQRAEQGEVTIRPVVLEKNDWIANHLDQNGNSVGGYYDLDNNRFYAAPNTAVRRYHEYFWRYLIARWGYSRAVHSWELMNEGDPYNGNHYAMADAFGRFMHQHDPHQHLVTTSFWHSFPQIEFWANPQYSGVDYADIHEYACCGNRYAGWAQNISSPLAFEDRPAYVVGGRGHSVRIPGTPRFNNAGGTLRHLIIRGRGEWVIRYQMKAENFQGQCEYGLPNSLAGPRLLWLLPDRSGVVPPPREEGKGFLCTAPSGTYDWRTFDSRYTHDSQLAPAENRLILPDDKPYPLHIAIQNGFGTSGYAWIDNIELISPQGQKVYLNGEFDLTSVREDSAHLTASLSLQIGGRTPSGPRKPVTRGEVAIGDDENYTGDSNYDQSRDTRGVWLHNFVWAQINPGGLIELYWDAVNIREYDLYYHFKTYRDFMDGIPLNNGQYEDAQATPSDPDLIALGQIDRSAGRGHLWLRHRQFTWRNVVDGKAITPIRQGSITLPNVPEGNFRVIWWDTWRGQVLTTQLVASQNGQLTLSLPSELSEDVAVKFERVFANSLYLPMILKSFSQP